MNPRIPMNITRRAGTLIAGLPAAALILAACSSGGGSAGGGGSARTALSPRQAVLAAATQTRQWTSFTELVTTRASGIQSETITGTIQVQLKPALRLAADLHATEPGKHAQAKEILTGTALYLSGTALNRQIGKPWVKVDLSALKGTAAAGFAQLLRSLQSSNFDNQAELLTVAKNARAVGTQTVDGVPATDYTGSINVGEARRALPASVRKFLAPEMQALGNSTMSFHVWIDGQHQMRKVTEVVTVNGQTVNTTMTVTALNQPVHITLPPASQTATRPGL